MGLFEDVVVNAKSMANAFGKKANEVIDISKLKISATDINNKINDKYQELGKTIYETKKAGKSACDVVKEKIAEIDNLKIQLETIKEQISLLKNKLKCKECGFENEMDAVFCIKCGAKLEGQCNCSPCNCSPCECGNKEASDYDKDNSK